MARENDRYQDYRDLSKRGRNTAADKKLAKQDKRAKAAKSATKGLRNAISGSSGSHDQCRGVRAGRRCTKRLRNPAKQTHCSSCLRHGAGWADD